MFRTTTLIVDEKVLQEWLRRKAVKDRAEGREPKVASAVPPALQASPLESLPTSTPRPHVG
jgi:hypothetical protein